MNLPPYARVCVTSIESPGERDVPLIMPQSARAFSCSPFSALYASLWVVVQVIARRSSPVLAIGPLFLLPLNCGPEVPIPRDMVPCSIIVSPETSRGSGGAFAAVDAGRPRLIVAHNTLCPDGGPAVPVRPHAD